MKTLPRSVALPRSATLPFWAALALALALPAACSREPAHLEARVQAALTPPAVIADWIIQGRNDFMLFDLRSADAFAAGHLPNAVRVEPAKLRAAGVVRALPDYKKLVFYGDADAGQGEQLAPLFARGLHVMILDGGYGAWQRQVLSPPEHAGTPELARRDAVARYFRGESALGTPTQLQDIPAKQYLRPAQLPPAKPAPTFESEGC
jgi:rhodanese-related sulfurtransferase